MKILVTGAAGFIGSHTVERLLERGDEVVGIDDFNDYYDPAIKRSNLAWAMGWDRFSLLEGDIRDSDSIDKLFGRHGFDAIIHLAARAGVRASFRDPALYQSTNVVGMMNLLESARNHGKPTFVYGSSSSVYGLSRKMPWREDDPADSPISPYAITKRTGELLCHLYSHAYGLNTCSLRFFTVYGPRQRPDMAIASFFDRILSGRPIAVFGDGSARRDFTFVHDIVRGIIAAADHPTDHEIINLGGSSMISVLELIEAIGQEVGIAPRIEFLDPQPGDVPDTWGDTSKAMTLLGWTPTATIRTGLKSYYQWLVDRMATSCCPASKEPHA